MPRTLILRFRDLVTEDGGTVSEHLNAISTHGEVWWGWWKKQHELVPRSFFAEIADQIDRDGFVEGYLFDNGLTKLYVANIAAIQVAPAGGDMLTPDPNKSPAYYHRRPYPAWFLL